MTKFGILGAAAILASTLAGPALAQEVTINPGKCAQFYPNANCQNYGPGNPYRGTHYQRRLPANGDWNDSYNRWNAGQRLLPGDVAAGVVGGAVGTAAAIATAPSPAMPMRGRTALSARPAGISAAKTAAGIFASKAQAS